MGTALPETTLEVTPNKVGGATWPPPQARLRVRSRAFSAPKRKKPPETMLGARATVEAIQKARHPPPRLLAPPGPASSNLEDAADVADPVAGAENRGEIASAAPEDVADRAADAAVAAKWFI